MSTYAAAYTRKRSKQKLPISFSLLSVFLSAFSLILMKKVTAQSHFFCQFFTIATLSLLFSANAWSADYYVATTGNDANLGITVGSPKLTIQAAITAAASGDVIHIADGTYTEDVSVTKLLTITGQSRVGTIIRGLYSGSANTILLGENGVVLTNLTVTRDYGANVGAWYASTKNQGINIAQFKTGIVIDNVLITGNRNGIYCLNSTITVQNSIISDNRTGVHLVGNVNGSIVRNNFIQNNFTHGVLLNADTNPGLTATNVSVTNNSITGNWYSQVNFQHNNPAVTLGATTGLYFGCNWYGTVTPTVNAINAAEPGYDSQAPSQFGGTNPNLPNRIIVGLEANLIPFTPFVVNGSDNDAGQPGFQPVPGSCGSTPSVSSLAVTVALGTTPGCTATLTGIATGSAFVFTGPNGYVFSNVYRIEGSHTIIADGIKTPGTYTLTVYGDGSVKQTIEVTGSPCN